MQDLIDLSRLQGAQAPPSPRSLMVAALINDAVERVRQAARARHIRVTRFWNGKLYAGNPRNMPIGNHDQI